MSVTMGFMLRVDSNLPAVALPPLQQGVRPAQPIIDAQKIVEPTSTAAGNSSRNHLLHRPADDPQLQLQLQTYSRKGTATSGHLLSGRMLDTYA